MLTNKKIPLYAPKTMPKWFLIISQVNTRLLTEKNEKSAKKHHFLPKKALSADKAAAILLRSPFVVQRKIYKEDREAICDLV